jgi:hypothetical protein
MVSSEGEDVAQKIVILHVQDLHDGFEAHISSKEKILN